ncbi:hypothetical protein H0H81_001026 [Sphagnurus paluster]|uniref:Uncharacterized protein n=1 Tax=Sphagnurus paluster TaxID=117069 RepID=A0A9P7G009_9AGAR|nr:hypothetical protein H0H81_001026 [Sphagnurus paluster]
MSAQSLPSFAQAFSGHSLQAISPASNALPPILAPQRKRPRDDIKHEDDSAGAPPPSSLRPSPSKKRRVTISGAPHALNTDVHVPIDHSNSTPISPVVMGFTVKRDSVDQVKSMLTVKHKQKALIEQRRGSVAGLVSPATPTTRTLRPSPSSSSSSSRRIPSPSPIIVPTQQQPPTHSLPPPPISFARRRAEQLGSARKKPADILISPRDPHSHDHLQPLIQSAPPIPHAGRFPTMALPRLPTLMAAHNVRRVATNVPPTPTRLSMHRPASVSIASPAPPPAHSPPGASVPIPATLVPPTPGMFHAPGYAGDKAAFLAPFEVFYDALNDSKQLKAWLAEQLQRSHALVQTLTAQQEKLDEVVRALVDKHTAGMRAEMGALMRRVEELEEAVGAKRHPNHPGSRTPLRNGVPQESYTFPPHPAPIPIASSSSHDGISASARRLSARHASPPPPNSNRQHDLREREREREMDTGASPAPFDAPPSTQGQGQIRVPTLSLPAPSLSRLDQVRSPLPPRESPASPQLVGKPGDRPGLSRQSSMQEGGTSGGAGGGPTQTQTQTHPPVRRAESRRNSVVMAGPESPGDDG